MLRTEGTYEFREAGITNVTVGELNYGDGIRNSFYSWETASGQEKSASAWYESVGGNSKGASVLSLQPLGWYGEGNRQLNKANLLAQSLGVPLAPSKMEWSVLPVLPNLQIRESGASAFAMRKI